MTKIVYQTDHFGRFVAAMSADLDPLETAATGSNVYLIPRGAVETPPPTVTSGHVAVWSGDVWNVVASESINLESEGDGPLDIDQWRASTTLSRFEMGEALIVLAILTEEQAEDFLRGVIPAPLEAMIDLLPEADRPLARRLTIGARDFARSDALWLGIANAPTGPSPSDVDALFGWVAP